MTLFKRMGINVTITKDAVDALVQAFCVGLIVAAFAGYLIHNHLRHIHYVQDVANSYHYQVGKSYYCYDGSDWTQCKILGVEVNYQEYFVQEVSGKTTTNFHVTPDNIAHDGKYYGSKT